MPNKLHILFTVAFLFPFIRNIFLHLQHIQQSIGITIIILQTMLAFQNIKVVNAEQSPCSRWGHAMVSIQNHIYVFGGYENSKYYNDLWRFDLISQTYEKINQQGQVPPPCSNFTLNYYQHQNTLLLFGGGTLNKEKLNSLYKLDMNTFVWRKVAYDQSSSLPWQRSYHCAEIIGHCLVITGGEFFHDLDDTWIFDLHDHQWKQIKLSQNALKPKARKFASSFVQNNKLYVIGGCSGKYECVEENFEMDFSEFLETGNIKSLSWGKVQLENKDLLVRWGHISLSCGNKAYVFGGRHASKDLQNLIQIDVSANTCQALGFPKNPKGRRRPAVCIKNNTLFCHSGFDGSYVKDFFYISLPENLATAKISEDLEGKNSLRTILAPNNIEESSINFEDEVIYATEEQFEQIQHFLGSSKQEEQFQLFEDINYRISINKVVAKSAYFATFLNGSFLPEDFTLYCPKYLTQDERIILAKMLISYFRFGKVIVQRCEFINSNKYFVNLLQISEYYCCDDLSEICKKQLLKFFTDQIVSHQSKIQNIINMSEVMIRINKQYEKYAGFFLLKKIVEKNRSAVNTLSDFKQYIKGSYQLTNKEWMLQMIEQHSFELAQLIIRKNQTDFENINSLNVPHKKEIMHEKTRKDSMHAKNINA